MFHPVPTEKHIAQFKELYKQQLGIELSEADAAHQAQMLLQLVAIIYRPIPKEWMSEIDSLR